MCIYNIIFRISNLSISNLTFDSTFNNVCNLLFTQQAFLVCIHVSYFLMCELFFYKILIVFYCDEFQSKIAILLFHKYKNTLFSLVCKNTYRVHISSMRSKRYRLVRLRRVKSGTKCC